jgi:DNA-binding MarR family transcriptional regulator
VELVNRAEAAGLVTRITDPTDRRRQLLALTAFGKETLEELSILHREELRRFREEGLFRLRAI